MKLELGKNTLRFMAVAYERDENRKTLIPLSLRFSLRLGAVRKDLAGRVLLFNRLEPSLRFPNGNNPKIGFVHNDVTQQLKPNSEFTWRHAPALYGAIESRMLRNLDYIYTVNANTLAQYRATYPQLRQRLEFLPTWVDDEVFLPPVESKRELRARLRKDYGVPDDGVWILFAGRLQQQKDPALLIQTLAAFVRTRPAGARLVIVGEGNLRVDIERLAAELGVAERLSIVGFLPQEELARFYQASDIFLLSSLFEGMPRAVMEAIGCGLPVVTTNVGEVGRVVVNGVTGTIVSERTAEALAAALTEALERPAEAWRAPCLAAIESYRPKSVLTTVYDRCAQLAQRLPIPPS
ncbi:MAG: glycosyltransferase [Steroidobacteraceae bacterium]